MKLLLNDKEIAHFLNSIVDISKAASQEPIPTKEVDLIINAHLEKESIKKKGAKSSLYLFNNMILKFIRHS